MTIIEYLERCRKAGRQVSRAGVMRAIYSGALGRWAKKINAPVGRYNYFWIIAHDAPLIGRKGADGEIRE